MRKRQKIGLPATYVEGFHDPEVVKRMPYRPLGGDTALDVSILSFGGSSLGSVFRDTDLQESINVVHTAVKSGINLIDTAPWYGHGKAEEVLGKALKGIPREAYYLNTKVGRYFPEPLRTFDFTAARVTQSVDESLARLQVDYIDCIQVHDPEFAPDYKVIVEQTLPALIKLKEAGKVKMVGLTGYPLSLQKKIIEAFPGKLDTCLTYCHYSMNDYSLTTYLPWLKEQRLGVINASAISMGLLSHRGPPGWHPAHSNSKVLAACSDAAAYCKSQDVDISTLAMAFTLANPDVPTTLVSTASLKRMKANIASCSYKLTAKEQAVSDHVMETFFKPLEGNEHWEGHEIGEYWKAVSEELAKEALMNKHYKGRVACPKQR